MNEEGGLTGWFGRCGRVILRLLHVDMWLISLRDLSQAQVPDRGAAVAVSFSVLTPAEIMALSRHHAQLSPSFAETALQRGDQCLAARTDDGIVGLTWRAVSLVQVGPQLELRLCRDHTFVGFKSWVDDSARGLRLFAAMRYAFDDASLQNGRSHGLSYVHVDNSPSLKSLARDPVVSDIGWVVHARWGRAGWAVVSPGARPWVAVEVKKGGSGV